MNRNILKVRLTVSALGILSSLVLAGQCQARSIPTGSSFDERVQSVDYHKGQVSVVRTGAGIATEIVLGEGEEVLDMACGYSQGWELVSKRNLIYIKPKSIAGGIAVTGGGAMSMKPKARLWNTNLLVSTNKRLYAFDLVVTPVAHAAFRVEMRFPDDIAAAKAAQEAAANVSAPVILNMAEKSKPVNYAYAKQIGKHSESIAPVAAWDDGRFIYLKFATHNDFPSVFNLLDDGKEELVDHHVDYGDDKEAKQKDTIVVHGLFHRLSLRSGTEVVFITNEHYDTSKRSQAAGYSSVPSVDRVVKENDGSLKIEQP
jgi:type IV secretion system protein VirB9